MLSDGELDCVGNILRDMERAGFEIHDVEGLRPHYALTLRHWVARLEARREDAIREVGEGTYRIWRLYMAACALEFDAGGTGVRQIRAPHLIWISFLADDTGLDVDDRQLGTHEAQRILKFARAFGVQREEWIAPMAMILHAHLHRGTRGRIALRARKRLDEMGIAPAALRPGSARPPPEWCGRTARPAPGCA